MGQPARRANPPPQPAKKPRKVLALDPARAPMPEGTFPGWRWQRVLELWVPADDPAPKGNSKNAFIVHGFARVAPPKRAARHERQLTRALAAALPDGWTPLRGAVRFDMRVDLPLPVLSSEHPTSWRHRALAGDPTAGPWGDGTGDRGNYLKMLEDCAKRLLFADDAQILGGPADKRWSTSPGWWCLVWRAVGDA
jgi:Holliday junction resolvase RusA-like endonuclease